MMLIKIVANNAFIYVKVVKILRITVKVVIMVFKLTIILVLANLMNILIAQIINVKVVINNVLLV